MDKILVALRLTWWEFFVLLIPKSGIPIHARLSMKPFANVRDEVTVGRSTRRSSDEVEGSEEERFERSS